MNANSILNRRRFLRRGASAAAVAALAACTPAPSPSPEPQAPAKETVVVKETVIAEATATYEQGELSIILCCSGPDDLAIREEFNQRFAEARPEVKVIQEPVPAGVNYFEKLQTVIAAGTAPDAFDMWEGYVQPYAKNGALTNLEPFFEKDPVLKKTDLWPTTYGVASWEGNLHALMLEVLPGPLGLYYNKKLFDAAGIAYPTNDWTWDKVRETANQLTIKQGDTVQQFGLTFETWFVPWLYWIWSNGGDVFNADETQCVLTDPKAYQAVQYWADLIVKDQSAPNSSTLQSMQGCVNMFKTDQVAMYVGNGWDLGALKAAESQGLQWGACMSPKTNDGNRCYYEHTACWGIWTGTRKPNLAWEYCRDYVRDPQAREALEKINRAVPAVKSLLSYYLTPETEALGWGGVVEIVNDPKKFRYPGAGDKWDKISGLIQAEFDLVFTGDKTAEQAAKDACPMVDEELARA